MRKILRTARKTFTVFLWVAKGLLLLMAVGVLVLWPMSRGRRIVARVERINAGPGFLDYRYAGGTCQNGGILIGGCLERGTGRGIFFMAWPDTATQGPGWRGVFISTRPKPVDRSLFSSFGPLQWEWNDTTEPNTFKSHRQFAAPCWLVAPALALWPLTSLTLLIRRRRRRRCRELLGCCQHCGYDLRATAAAGGPLLASCPECGAGAAAPHRKEA